MTINNEQNKGLFSGLFVGYAVLILHILLILGLGFAVVFIKGLYDFRHLILLLGLVIIGGSAYLFYRRVKAGNRKLTDLMSDPALRDRTLEISLLGGMASVKLGHKDEQLRLVEAEHVQEIRQLEAPKSSQVEELGQLAKMLEDELITREEFQQLKQKIVSQQ